MRVTSRSANILVGAWAVLDEGAAEEGEEADAAPQEPRAAEVCGASRVRQRLEQPWEAAPGDPARGDPGVL